MQLLDWKFDKRSPLDNRLILLVLGFAAFWISGSAFAGADNEARYWRSAVLRRSSGTAIRLPSALFRTTSFSRTSSRSASTENFPVSSVHLRAAAGALKRARAVAQGEAHDLRQPELLALELREGLNAVSAIGREWAAEEVLGRVFSQFCVGK